MFVAIFRLRSPPIINSGLQTIVAHFGRQRYGETLGFSMHYTIFARDVWRDKTADNRNPALEE